MSMVPAIVAVMNASAAVKAQLGTPTRFYLNTAPADPVHPYATWMTVGGSPMNLMSDTPPADGWRIRITVWGKTLTQANNAAMAIRDEIERRGEIESFNPTPDDDDTGTFGISFDARLLTLR